MSFKISEIIKAVDSYCISQNASKEKIESSGYIFSNEFNLWQSPNKRINIDY
jgi:hypothetical protein